MIKFLLWIWQFPQNIIGFLLSRDCLTKEKVNDIYCYYTTNVFGCGVSLGNYILLDEKYLMTWNGEITKKHEYGHSIQSRYLGIFYLLVVGLPSVVRNIYHRIHHDSWTRTEQLKWYYSGYPEKWADELGGVEREY